MRKPKQGSKFYVVTYDSETKECIVKRFIQRKNAHEYLDEHTVSPCFKRNVLANKLEVNILPCACGYKASKQRKVKRARACQ